MNKSVAIILSILFLMILLGSLGVFIYNVFNNTAYPDESEDLVNTTDNAEDLVNNSDNVVDNPKSLSQLTLDDATKDMTILARGYLQPPTQSRFQCVLPLFLDN